MLIFTDDLMTFMTHRSLKLVLTILVVVTSLWLIAHLWANSTSLSLLGHISEHGTGDVTPENAGRYSTLGIQES